MATEMSGHQRIRMHLNLQQPDRIGFYESTVWPETLERWVTEGYPEGIPVWEFFDFDMFRLQLYPTFGFDDVLIREEGEVMVRRSVDGNLYRIARRKASAQQHLDYFIRTREDWEKNKHLLRATPERFTEKWLDDYADCKRKGRYTMLSIRQPLWAALNKVGMVKFMELIYDDPDWIHDMLRVHMRFVLDILDLADELGHPTDGVYLVNGTVTASGSGISPRMYRELGVAYDKVIGERLKERDQQYMLHWDGNWNALVQETIDSGFDGVGMIEARSKMNVIDLKRRYGDELAFMGNIDCDVLSSGDRSRIEHEVVTKVTAAMKGGGYIYHSDGSIPPTVSFDDFTLAWNLARKIGSYE